MSCVPRVCSLDSILERQNSARTLDTFSATLCNEVDLEQLLAVVQETMQPAHDSLWLRPTERDGKGQPWRANSLPSYHMDE